MPSSSRASHRSATILDGSKVEFLDGFRDSVDDEENNVRVTNSLYYQSVYDRRDETRGAAMPLKWTRPYSFNKGKRVLRSTSSIPTVYQTTRTPSFRSTTTNVATSPLRQEQQRLLRSPPSRPTTNMTHRSRSHLPFGSNRSEIECSLNSSTESSPMQQFLPTCSPPRTANIQHVPTISKTYTDEKLGCNKEYYAQGIVDARISQATYQQFDYVQESVQVLKLHSNQDTSIPHNNTSDDSFRSAAIRSVGKKGHDISASKFGRRNSDIAEGSSIDVVFSVGTHISDDEVAGPYRRPIGVRTSLSSQEYIRKHRSDSSMLNASSHSTGPRYIRSKSAGTNTPLQKSRSGFFSKSKKPLHLRSVSQDYSETDTSTTVSTEEEKRFRNRNKTSRKSRPAAGKLEQAFMSCSPSSACINAIYEGTETSCFLDLESDDDDSEYEVEVSSYDRNFPDDERHERYRRMKQDNIMQQNSIDKKKIKANDYRTIKSVPSKNSIVESKDGDIRSVNGTESKRKVSLSLLRKKKNTSGVTTNNKVKGRSKNRTTTNDSIGDGTRTTTYDTASCRSSSVDVTTLGSGGEYTNYNNKNNNTIFNCSQFVSNFTKAMIDECIPPDPIIGPTKFFKV